MKLNISNRQKKYLIGAILLLVASLFGIDLSELKNIQKGIAPSPTPNPALNDQTFEAKVTSVVDGDTIVVEGNQKVRYIGINTPEIYKDTTGKKTGEQCFANESFQANKRLVEGKTVRLVRDVSNTDKYGRLLRYVYSDGVFVNEHLVKNGYARTMTVKPDVKYYDAFKIYQAEAKDGGLGLWSACPTSTPGKPQK